MAQVFLSYDREDQNRAKAVAKALESIGHSVWWDRHIKGGAQYSDEIEEALNRADAVVVLWSPASVRSAWVRDEAAAGRDSGRLVPILIKSVDPPMGFRQYQTIDLTRWNGKADGKQLMELNEAVDALGEPIANARPALSKTDTGPRRLSPRALVVVLGMLALFLVSLVGWKYGIASKDTPSIAVAASDNSPASAALVRDLLVKLGRLQTADPNALRIVAEPGRKSAAFTFQVSASPTRERASATVALIARDKTLLWSKDFERPKEQFGDLKQQLALTAARVLACATEGVTDKDANLDQRTLKLYLNGCANLSELAWQDFRGIVSVFREVTMRAPKFDDGWAKLVETEAYVLGWETVPSTSPEGRTLAKDIAAARKLNPRMPEAYWAEYMLVGEYDLVRAAEVLERATRDNVDDPKVAGMRVPFHRRVGRMRESVDDAKLAADHNPLDPGLAASYIEALTYSGKREAALQEINKAERLWPGTRPLIDARFRFHLRYGDPNEALRIVRSGINPDYAHSEPFLIARIDPTKENVDRAIAMERAEVGRHPRSIGRLVLALAQFGLDDLIYPIVESSRGQSALYLSDALFRPELDRFRQNPRFMRGAKNIGLLAYWEASGNWPDFCFEPDLPYDCKQEAARLVI